MEYKRDLEMIKGDSSPILNIAMENYKTLSSDWTARLVVTNKLGSGTYIIDKPIYLDSTASFFLSYLTPEESNMLSPGKYYLVVEVKNSILVPPVRLESQYLLNILPGGILN